MTETVRHDGAEATIWRDAPSWSGRRTAAVGAFSCERPQAGAALLNQIAQRLAGERFEAVVGPMDGDTWARYRLVVESSERPPFLLEPQNPEHYPAAFEQAGWPVIGRYVSAEGGVDERGPGAAPAMDLRVRSFDPARAEEELLRIHAVSLRAFSKAFLYRPISAEAFLASYQPVLPAIDPDFVLMAEDQQGELQGYVFGIPDLTQGPQPTAVILKTYASLKPGGGSRLGDAFYAAARRRGFQTVVHALMHADNLSATHSARSGGKIIRRYALWGRTL